MATVIRKAVIDDADAIAALAYELNTHQGEPVEFFTADAIRRDGFGENAAFRVMLAEVDAKVVGYAIYLPTYSTEHAEPGTFVHDLYVAEAHRSQGIGRALIDAVAAISKRDGRDWVWWASKAWNQKAQLAYRSWGALEQPIRAHALVFNTFKTSAERGDQWLQASEAKKKDET